MVRIEGIDGMVSAFGTYVCAVAASVLILGLGEKQEDMNARKSCCISAVSHHVSEMSTVDHVIKVSAVWFDVF